MDARPRLVNAGHRSGGTRRGKTSGHAQAAKNEAKNTPAAKNSKSENQWPSRR
jgi:hypothetical protein